VRRMIFAVLLCFATAALFAQKAGDKLYVSVESAPLRSSAGLGGSTIETVKYGDEIRVNAVKTKWIEAQKSSGGKTGWIEYAKLTTKRISNQGNTGNASARETSMAGKGFSPEVESEYKKNGGQLNYPAVDAMEKEDVSDSDLLAFIEDGHLALGE